MLNVGLTGNVAAGKSTVSAFFRDWGATVIDADALARDVQAPGSAVLAAIAERFGREMIAPDGKLDRARLRGVVAGDSHALAALNAIVHPAVQRRRREEMERAKADGVCLVVQDIPLLFEVLDPADFDAVVLVDAPEPLRLRRVMEHRGIAEDEARRLLASQMPSDRKRDASRFVIDNDGTRDAVESAAREVWHTLRRDAAVRMAPSLGAILAVFAHPDDESFGAGGTLARYATAGAEIHLLCLTAGEAATHRGGTQSSEGLRDRRRSELRVATETLGISAVRIEDFPDGGLTPDDPKGIAVVKETVRSARPDAIITFGSDGVTGHPDHVAVHTWVAAAKDATGPRSQPYYLTYPEAVAAALGRITGRPEAEIAVRLDVRPWRAEKLAAIAAHESQRFPFDPHSAPGNLLFEREWYAGGPPAHAPRFDLFGTA